MSNTGNSVSLSGSLLRKLGRLARFIVFVCTSGWLFPHAATEDMDLTAIQNKHLVKKP